MANDVIPIAGHAPGGSYENQLETVLADHHCCFLALLPPPEGLSSYAWLYFAIFAGVIAGLIIENLPGAGAGVGLIGVALVMVLSQYVLFSPEQLAKEGFKPATEAIKWGLSGFANNTVWLIFAAFMFALGYEKSGLGKRVALQLVKVMGKRTLTLGYAVVISDLIIARSPHPTPRAAAARFTRLFVTLRNCTNRNQTTPRCDAWDPTSCGWRSLPPASPAPCSSPD